MLPCHLPELATRSTIHTPHSTQTKPNTPHHTKPRTRRNYTSKLQDRGVPRSEVEAFIRTQLGFSAGCCRDACRFSFMLCGCEGGVVTMAMRLIGCALVGLGVGGCGLGFGLRRLEGGEARW